MRKRVFLTWGTPNGCSFNLLFIYLFPFFILSEDHRAPPGGVFPLCLAPKLRIRQDLCAHLSPHGGWSFVHLMSGLTVVSEVLAGLELLRSKAVKMLGLLPLNIKSSVFKALLQLCVESNYLKNVEEQRDFFPPFNPLASQFCICKKRTIYCCS